MALAEPSNRLAEINNSGTPTPVYVVTLPAKGTESPDVLTILTGILCAMELFELSNPLRTKV